MNAYGDGLSRRHLYDLDFIDAASVGDVDEALSRIDTARLGERLPLVVTPNVDHLVQLRDAERALIESTRRAVAVLPDGQPIVWSSRICGRPLGSRLTGSDLFGVLWSRSVEAGSATLVIAPSREVASGLSAQSPDAVIVVPPMFEAGDRSARAAVVGECLAAVIAAGSPEIDSVLICIGQPKQQYLALDLIDSWPQPKVPLFYCLGASAEMHLGLERRAPLWVTKIGAEFLFRFAKDPRRLFRRYFIDDPVFVVMAAKEWLSIRRVGP